MTSRPLTEPELKLHEGTERAEQRVRERLPTVRPEPETARAGARPSGIQLRDAANAWSESVRPPSLRPRSLHPEANSDLSLAELWQEYFARIQDAPESGTVRGLYFSEILRLVPALKANHRRRYVPFSKYPLREYMQLLVEAAQFAYQGKAPEYALRELGMTTYATFAASMAGASLLSSPAFHEGRVLDLAPQAYPLTIDPVSVEVVSKSSHDAVVKLRDLWIYPESFQKGVWLGAMRMLGVNGSIEVIRHGWCSVDFHIRWTNPSE